MKILFRDAVSIAKARSIGQGASERSSPVTAGE